MLSRLIITDHAQNRMIEYRVSVKDVRQVLAEGETVQSYPEDRPYESRLVLVFLQGRPLHVVAADAHDLDTTFVITVYEPDPDRWEADFKTRKRDE